MAYIFHVHSVFAIEGLFKREDAQNFFDPALYAFHAMLTPGPELRSNKINYRDAASVHLARHAKIKRRRINDHGDGGLSLRFVYSAQQFAEFRVDFRQMPHDLSHADDGEVP